MWYRVFGGNDAAVDPEALLEHLHLRGLEVSGHFRGDEQGWFHADIRFGGELAVEVERFLCSEEGIRAQLNTWAAWLESLPDFPRQIALMQQMIATRQLFTLNAPAAEHDAAADICLALCRFLSTATDGIYQIDGQGLFDVQGTLLIADRDG